MKAVILAGGFGTRLSEETSLIPKPLIPIGDHPILWHIMKTYASHGVSEFIICLGYKGNLIKEYFSSYFLHNSDVTFDLSDSSFQIHGSNSVNWKVTLVDTGLNTYTGGRLKRIEKYLNPDEDFLMTYGDGVGDIDISASIAYHKKKKCLATLTAARPQGRYGVLNISEGLVTKFQEKAESKNSYINAGYFILNPAVLNYIKDDSTIWENEPLEQLANSGELCAFEHNGFWHPMDTLRDKKFLEKLWVDGKAKWKLW